VLGTTALLEFRAQRPGTEEPMSSLLGLKRQVEALLARSVPSPDTEAPAPPDIPDADLNRILKEQGVQVPAGSDRRRQLELLLETVNGRIVAFYEPAVLTGKDLVTAGRQQQQTGSGWEVTLNFTREGGDRFARLTQSIAGSRRLLGIVLDGRSISEASVGPEFAAAGITGGSASISGNFSAEQARDALARIRCHPPVARPPRSARCHRRGAG
jgi:preprotein translocase subunit SecD